MEMVETVDLEVVIVLLQVLCQTLSVVGLFRIVGHQDNLILTVQILDFAVLMDVLIPVSMDQFVIIIYNINKTYN